MGNFCTFHFHQAAERQKNCKGVRREGNNKEKAEKGEKGSDGKGIRRIRHPNTDKADNILTQAARPTIQRLQKLMLISSLERSVIQLQGNHVNN